MASDDRLAQVAQALRRAKAQRPDGVVVLWNSQGRIRVLSRDEAAQLFARAGDPGAGWIATHAAVADGEVLVARRPPTLDGAWLIEAVRLPRGAT